MQRAGRGGKRVVGLLGLVVVLLAWNGGTQTQLELCFGGAEERLVNLGFVGVEDDIRGGGVGVALEYDLLASFKLEDASELNMGDQVSIVLLERVWSYIQATEPIA